ncbi:uncharacterized protein N7469_004623 [Penicillium citrinum]|uniref:Zn(2)-C6 fungal-type domain-containing protein n=1 Tax=Penicillium citrinum TaxID=5077 RepID=A0A9W9P5E3_PENCI|nr:uncharacterized protein N7469_004623 [Penicillium citrinum]KAJ5235455.1 hypothetical protein N7469_004623 [Penicillium citrinum]
MSGPVERTGNVRRRNGSKHDKTGCLTCRYRRKKCTLNTIPICGDCKRLNLECVREPTRQVLPTASTPTMPAVFQWENSQVDGTADKFRRRAAMKFYVTVLSQLLTTLCELNVGAAFLPMTLESPALADALVAWSAGHLASHDSRYRTTALEARSTALGSLAMSLSSQAIPSSEVNAATSLVIMTSEVCLGYHTQWYSHLIGTKNIIMSTQCPESTGTLRRWGPDALKQSTEGQWILRNFAYHDILGSVTLGKPPLIPSCYLQDIADVIDTYLGVAFGVLLIISDISCLEPLELVADYLLSNSLPKRESGRFSSIERRLQTWECPPGTNLSLESLAYTYRSSALIYLYRRALRELRSHRNSLGVQCEHPIRDLHSKIQNEVLKVLQHTDGIPSSAIVESALLFPLFIAGGEATDHSHVSIIRSRLELMLHKRHFRNIYQSLEVLKCVWEQRKASQGTADYSELDWKDIIDQQGGVLLLT